MSACLARAPLFVTPRRRSLQVVAWDRPWLCRRILGQQPSAIQTGTGFLRASPRHWSLPCRPCWPGRAGWLTATRGPRLIRVGSRARSRRVADCHARPTVISVLARCARPRRVADCHARPTELIARNESTGTLSYRLRARTRSHKYWARARVRTTAVSPTTFKWKVGQNPMALHDLAYAIVKVGGGVHSLCSRPPFPAQ